MATRRSAGRKAPRPGPAHDSARPGLDELRPSVPILRLFRARAKPGCEQALGEKLATTSVEVVRDQPGFLGFIAGGPAHDAARDFVFVSTWTNAEALKACFGREWRVSLLPPGYAELIEDCSVEHYELAARSGEESRAR
jgi:quinol monooxygenase YgiN